MRKKSNLWASIRVNWCPFVVKKFQNKIDTLSRIQIKTAFHRWNLGKLTTPGEITLLRLTAYRRQLHSAKNPSNEKEIRFQICILQTARCTRRFALLCGDHNCRTGAVSERVTAREFAADCAGRISKRNASVPQAKPLYGGLVGRQPRPLRQHLDRRV